MVGAVIRALLYLCGLALLFYLCVWVLGQLGIALPLMVVRILGVMFVLVAILILYRLFAPLLGNVNWWGPGPPPP